MTRDPRAGEPDANPTDDATLVLRCLDAARGGDRVGGEGAWSELVRRHGPLAWAVIRRAGVDGADAADVYQTAWLAALQSLPRLRDPSRFAPWLARTAHLQAVRLRRTYGITRRVLSRVDAREEDDRAPDEDIERFETRGAVAAALSRVGARCESLLRALYYEDPPPAYADLARRLGMPVGSIGPTRARCLEKLDKLMGGGS